MTYRPRTCECDPDRGTVTGADWRRPDPRQRYRGHFPPFLERRFNALG